MNRSLRLSISAARGGPGSPPRRAGRRRGRLAGDDAPGREAAPVADGVDLVAHRFGGVAGPGAVGAPAVGGRFAGGGGRRAQPLGDDLAAVQAVPRIARTGTDVRVGAMEHEV